MGLLPPPPSGGLREQQQAATRAYAAGKYAESQRIAEELYLVDAARPDNLLLLGAVNFQLRNYSEAIFYNQQAIKVDPTCAEAYSNLGNSLKELGDVQGAMAFYLKAIKHAPRFADAYNNLASAHMHLGQTAQAAETYEMALVLDPTLVDAHCNLGNLYKAQGKLAASRKCHLEAIRLRPDFAIAWSNLAGIFKDEGASATAIAYYREAIRLCPAFADAYSNLGSVMQDRGDLREAKQCYLTALTLRPDFAVARGNLGSCLLAMGEHDEAARELRHAIQLEPNFPDAYNTLGNALAMSKKSLKEAVGCYRRALRLKSDHPHAYSNLGNAMRNLGLIKEAVHCYVSAARLRPDLAVVHANLGALLREQGQLNQAIAHLHKAIALDPTFAECYVNLGSAYRDSRQPKDALDCYESALKIAPESAGALTGLGAALTDLSRFEEALVAFDSAGSNGAALMGRLKASEHLCDWSSRPQNLTKLAQLLEKQLNTDSYDDAALDTHVPAEPFFGQLPSAQPFDALTLSQICAPRDAQRIARRFAAAAEAKLALVKPPNFKFAVGQSEVIKVGYISSCFVDGHPVGALLKPALAMHSEKFHVTMFSTTTTEEDGFRDLSNMTALEVARQIHAAGIDVLVHCDGPSEGLEVLALKPAPIQLGLALGFPGTYGADYVDYLVVDDTLLSEEIESPAATAHDADEAVVSLPSCCVLNGHAQSFPLNNSVIEDSSSEKENYGLADDAFVFAYHGELCNLDPLTFEVWCSILKRVPNSLLWLVAAPDAAKKHVLENALALGIRGEQIRFCEALPRKEAMRRMQRADLFLDSPKFNAVDAVLDALWTATPVVTLLGATMATRLSASMCRAAGCAECVTATLDEYEELAVRLAVDVEAYVALRSKLDAGRFPGRGLSALFDTQKQISELEQAFVIIKGRFDHELKPVDIYVRHSKSESRTTTTTNAPSVVVAGDAPRKKRASAS